MSGILHGPALFLVIIIRPEIMNPSDLIDKQIAGTPGWRGELLAKLRKVISEADPGLKEEWKWGTAVWTHNGLVCAIGAFKDHVKINFFKGAVLKDPHKIINAGFDSKQHRALDFSENDKINEPALKELILDAVSQNSKGK
jgi:hypothetical protein